MKYTIVLIPLLAIFVSCGGDNEIKEENTRPNVESRQAGQLKIAYYDQDSINKNTHFIHKEDSILQMKSSAFQRELQKRSGELQSYINAKERENQQGLLSINDQEAIQREVMRRQQSIGEYQESEGRRLERENANTLEVMFNKIKKYSKEFCEENNIDILLINSTMAPNFMYIDSTMNVTKEFTAFMNKRNAEMLKGDSE